LRGEQGFAVQLGGQDLVSGGPASVTPTPLTLFCSRKFNEMCFGPGEAVALRLARGQIENLSLRCPPFQLLLMSRIQSGDGTARTDAEDEEHKPFSHGSASSPG
jgi:hypothetical protein